MVYVDQNSIINVNYYGTILRFNPDGELMGEYTSNFTDNQLEFYNLENSTITQCSHDPKTNILTCREFLIGSEDPLWETSIPNIDDFNAYSSTISAGNLYIFGDDNTLYKYAIGQP